MRNTILKLTHNTAWYTFVNVAKLLTYIASVFIIVEIASRVHKDGVAIAAIGFVVGYAFYGCYVFGKLRRERELAEEQRMMERLSN